MYDLRHIDNHKEEIDILINKMYIFRKSNDDNFLVFAHYPTEPQFSIFHMHTFGAAFDFAEKTTTNYINLTILRSFLWSKQLKYIKYQDKTILLKISGEDTSNNTLKKYGRSLLLK